jgi:MoxR-like ATPase
LTVRIPLIEYVSWKRRGPILIDELDKMSRQFQNQLLNFMESGHVKVDQQRKQYDFEIKGTKVFATAKEVSRLFKPLQSRLRRLFLPRYTEEQFLDVAVKVCPKFKEDSYNRGGSVGEKGGHQGCDFNKQTRA